MPQISLPNVKLPDVRFRDARLRDVKLPDIDLRGLPDVDLRDVSVPKALREMSMPDMKMPDVKMPDVKMSDFHMPDVHMPDVHMPDISMPDLKRPDLHLRDVRMPDLRMRDFKMPKMDMPDVDLREIRSAIPFGRPAPKPASPLPWVLLAGVAGLFAGWWLSTSSVTGPKVRQIADRVRARIDEMRNGADDWDEAVEERTEGFWANEQGWKTEGSQPGPGGPINAEPEEESEADSWPEHSAATLTSSESTIDDVVGDTGGLAQDESIGGTAFEPGSREPLD
jgi:hypothetical protein